MSKNEKVAEICGPAQIDFDTIYIVNKLPKLGVGGGVIWAMPKKMGIFSE